MRKHTHAKRSMKTVFFIEKKKTVIGIFYFWIVSSFCCCGCVYKHF